MSSPAPSSSSMKSSDGSETEGSDAVGLSNPEVGQDRRKILDLINRLHNTGVQADIDLPRIAVIGIQSAGKSSLIEAISGITLPRASGTCTRCPTECRLSSSEKPWKCVVSLRFTTDAKGQPLGQAKNVPFGSPIFKRSEVEDRIRRAQRAILNPRRAPDEFLHGDAEETSKSELSFSINCVSLQISGPDVTDLSFCDLPGLISSVGSGGSIKDIGLVENLVKSYIKQPSCIILLTVACETDFENQGAHHLAKLFDPEGKRTVGVLTKPDRIPAGEERRWQSFLMNFREPLQNGWFCVKQPSSKDLEEGITWQEARKREDQYFMTSPWSEMDSTCQRFLRTSNLVQTLSFVLSDLISKRLPEIQEELERCIDQTALQLGELPKEPSDDPMSEVMNLIHTFAMDVTRHTNGISEPGGLLQTIRPAQEQFRREIRKTAPDFRPVQKGPKTAVLTETPSEYVVTDDDNEDENEDDSEVMAEPRPRGHSPDGVVLGEHDGPRVFYIDTVMEKARQARTRELPGNYPFVVQVEFIKETVKLWRLPALRFCKIVHQAVLNHIKLLIHDHFSSYGQGVLEQRVKTFMQIHLKQCWERAEERIVWLLELEDSPSTLNYHYFFDYRDKFLAFYKGARVKDRHPDLLRHISKPPMQQTPANQNNFTFSSKPTQTSPVTNRPAFEVPFGKDKVMQGLVEMGITGVKPEDIPKLLPPDPMEPALLIMADVRAYFQVAYKRFADNVPNAIDVALIKGIEKNLLSKICTALRIRGKEGAEACKELAKENPLVSNKRDDLRKKLERLNLAAEELLSMSG